MAEVQTPVLDTPAVTPGTGGPKKKKKKGMSRGARIALTIIILAAVAIAVAVVLYLFIFKEDTSKGTAMTDFVSIGSIQSTVEGSGTTKAKDSATITPTSGGTVLEVFVQEGDQVTEGQPLYTMDDTAAQKAVSDAQKAVDDAAKTVTNCQKELQAVYDSIADLTITAPHAGKLMDVASLKRGDDVSVGDKIATLVNDTKLRLSLYYSYAYEGQISKGQSVQISIPAVMATRSGKVEQVNYVRRVVPEGGVMFEVILVLDNPGTLTEGMDASAAITAADGTAIYPYENGKLEYYETTEITAKARGPVESINLMNYADVKAGALLVQLGEEDQDEEIASKELALQSAQEALKTAQDKLTEAQEGLANHNAVAPISGTVLACSLVAGTEVQSGQAITIADTSVMTIEIKVDERNIQYVKPGMWVDIDQYGNYFGGVVESVSQIANAENGVATFPAVVKVDNPDGLLMSNMYVSYSFVASQSDNCLTVPIQAVKYVTLADTGGMAGDDGMMEDGAITDGDLAEPVPEAYTGGAAPSSLGMVISSSGGSVSIGGGSGGRPGGSSGDGTATIVFVKADTMPENGIAEPDPAWECPEGFWAVPVEVGLADTTRAEILSGLNEGDEVFIGYETQSADSWG